MVLQAHHKFYLKHLKPWEYEFEDCEALCKGCHARIHGKIPPDADWDFWGEEDFEEPTETCELCGTKIRYVFLVSHPNWPTMEVGEICCDKLTSTKVATEFMKDKRSRVDRKKRFLKSTRWKPLGRFSEELKEQGISMIVVHTGKSYRIRVNGKWRDYKFPNVSEAKGEVFEILEGWQ